MAHAGRAHAETTEEFESIHGDYAEQKLSGNIFMIFFHDSRIR